MKKPGQAPVCWPSAISDATGRAQKKPLRCHQPAFLGLPSSTGPVVDTTTGSAGCGILGCAGLRRDGRGSSRRPPSCRRCGDSSRQRRSRCRRLGGWRARRLLGRDFGNGSLPLQTPLRRRFRASSACAARASASAAGAASACGSAAGDGLPPPPAPPRPDGIGSAWPASASPHRRRQRPPSRPRAGGCACRRACRAGASCGRRRLRQFDACIGVHVLGRRRRRCRRRARRRLACRLIGRLCRRAGRRCAASCGAPGSRSLPPRRLRRRRRLRSRL